MYTVNVSFENKDGIHSENIKILNIQQKKAILEKALSTFYKKNIKITNKK